MHLDTHKPKIPRWPLLALLAILMMSSSALAQGSIFGVVANSDLSTPANGEITFVGFLDDTDEEIRIESSDGAGYDNGNWFDDFQNYLTEAPGNPYDYYFHNITNGQGFHLAKLIPNNSFQQENVLLSSIAWPAAVTDIAGSALNGSSVLLSWSGSAGVTYHIYRRPAVSNGSFFRLDNPAGSLADPGVGTVYYVDNTVDGASSYDYLIIAEDGSGNYSPHSAVATINSAAIAAPVLDSIVPNAGVTLGGTPVILYGSGFDPAGTDVTIGLTTTPATVVSPYELTLTTPAGAAGPADVSVTNVATALVSNVLTGGFTYNPNATPVLAAIGAQSTTEGVLLSFAVSASDVDGDIALLTTSTLPVGASFVDNTDGTGLFTWTPGFVEAGTYNVTFYATDAITPSLIDSEQVVITVIEAGNQAPQLAAVNDTSIVEGAVLNLAISATDLDGEIPTLSTSTLPTNATFVDNGDGTGNLNFAPDFTQTGSYPISFYAADAAEADSILVTVTVTEAGNQQPVLAAIGPQTVAEGVLLTVPVSATDAEGIPALATSTLPTGATFLDNADGTGAFTWTPTFVDAGAYQVTFYASDGVDTDSEIVDITVTEAGNQAPVLAAIGPQGTTENIQLLFAVSASDPDGTIPTLSTATLPAGAVFTDNLDGTGSFDWTPTFTDSGSYPVMFYTTDGIETDSELVTITVTEAGNQLPVLAAIGPQGTTEDVLLTFAVSATDAESIPVLTTSLLPTGATFIDNGDGTGTFDWTPDFTQGGTYDVSFYASDGIETDSELVTITVAEVGNQAPVLAAIGAQSTTENIQLLVAISAVDVDGTIPTLSTSTLPAGALFTDNLDGTGLLDWTPLFTDAGDYPVTFYATDGVETDSEQVTITVLEAGNQAPVLAAIGPQTAIENVLLTFIVNGSDPDGTIPALSTDSLPLGATFVDNADGTGTFDWTPDFTQAGSYDVMFYVDDGALMDSQMVTITVNDGGNQVPTLDSIGAQFAVEGTQMLLTVTASDPETIPVLSTSVLPTGAVFVDSGNGLGVLDWTPDFTQAGSYSVTFYATDDVLMVDSEVVVITVSDAGAQAPVVTVVSDTIVNEGEVLILDVSAYDPDGGAIFLTVNTSLLNFTFLDNGDGTGALTYTPDFFDANVDTVVFLATDYDVPQRTGSAVSRVVTIEVNQPPEFELVGPFSVKVNRTLDITVTAYDSTDAVTAHVLYLSAVGVPNNAAFVDNGDGTGSFTFTPQAAQIGVDTVTFLATDQGNPQLTASMQVEITVVGVNTPPVLDPIGPQTILEGDLLTINLSASDPDGTTPYFTMDSSALGGSATLVDNGDGTAVFTWVPGFTMAGLVDVSFYAHDGIDYDREVVIVQVYEAGDQPPVFDPLPSPTVTEADTAVAVISAYDPDAGPVTISVVEGTLPPNFIFFDSGNGIATLTMMPDYTQSGVYIIGIIVDDGTLADTSDFAVTVQEIGNQTPVLDTIIDYTVNENENIIFTISASDLDGVPTLSITGGGLPANPLTDNGDGTGTFNWTPGYFDAGVYTVTFTATDDADPGLTDSRQMTLTVVDVNRLPWSDYISEVPDSISEGDTVYFGIFALDEDSTTPEIRAFLEDEDTLATNMYLDSTYIDTDNNMRVSYLMFAPDYSQGSAPNPTFYQVRFEVCDGADPTFCRPPTTPVTFRVYNKNQPPQIILPPDSTGPFTITEGETITLLVTAMDDVGMVDSLVAEDLPAGATFSGLQFQKTFTFTPGFTQSGQYLVSFIAYDNGGLTDTAIVEINVIDGGNQAPQIITVLPETTDVFIDVLHQDVLDAVDPDLDSIVFTAITGSPNMAFSYTGAPGSAQGLFGFVPAFSEADAVYEVQFIATDYPGGLTDVLVRYYHVLPMMRGDVDSDNSYSMNDIVYLINYFFRGGPAPDPLDTGDVDRNGAVNVADIAYLVNYLYNNGPAPPQ